MAPSNFQGTDSKVTGLGIINVPELSPGEALFINFQRYQSAPLEKLSGLPRNRLEKIITKPNLARYRAALQSALKTHRYQKPIVISHLPLMSAAIAALEPIANKRTKHIAFAFNFTDLPQDAKKRYLQWNFEKIHKFVVFSGYEKKLYSEYFQIPPEKIITTIWTQNAPPLNKNLEKPFPGKYLCAIGGEGRDMPTLLQAARLSQIPLVVITRPHKLENLKIPSNVKILYNLPLADAWGIAHFSQGGILPLLSEDTCCGQITLVSHQMLGIPILATQSKALAEYLEPQDLTVEASQPEKLAEKMRFLIDTGAPQQPIQGKYDKNIWTTCIETLIDELVQ